MDADASLLVGNQRLHGEFLQRYRFTMAALLRGDCLRACAEWDLLQTDINRHAVLEELQALPLSAGLDLPRGADPRVLRHDHELLRVSMQSIQNLLAEASVQPPERLLDWIVERLARITAFESLFEHHTERECKLFYSTLDRRLMPAQRMKLYEVLFEIS
ncbi:MAG: hypothetical protein K1X75_15045 [Leptospirales bacterium]|nr:hypothetical protein [Leptospirales bacterium]